MSETPPTAAGDFEDCLGILRIYKDGSTWRSNQPIFNVPVNVPPSVTFKDTTFDQQNNLKLRLYKPTSTKSTKLPIVYHIHGGGFCLGSIDEPNFQNCCFRLASQLEAVVISPAYRLAPESRLPAAIDDCYAALKWLQSQAVAAADPWLSEVADFEKVFVTGESAGGNIVHHLAVRVGAGSGDLGPVKVKGYVLLDPFFGGVERTKSEAEAPKDLPLNLNFVDWFFRHSVPAGETSDYPAVNPFGPKSKDLSTVEINPMLVVAGGKDVLVDRIRDYADKLKQMGKTIQYAEFEAEHHAFFTTTPESEAANSVMDLIKKFVTQHSN
ncbi:Probable carboxylesterase 15 [Linum grandiflorum]